MVVQFCASFKDLDPKIYYTLHCKYIQQNDSGMTAEQQWINVISIMWNTWKNCNPDLQFFHVSHMREITLIRCHSAVCICSVRNASLARLMPYYSAITVAQTTFTFSV